MLNETSTPNAMGDFVMDTTSPQGGNTPRGYALSIHKPDPSIVGGFAMASTTPFPNTPGAYVSVKTPEGHASDHDLNAGVSAWSTRFRWAGNGAQIMVFLTMALYIIGLIGYYTKFFDVTMTDEIKKWLRVPADQVTGYGAPTEDFKGHPEMLIPIYFMIFNVMPVFLGVLLIEFLRHYNVRRISSQYMLKVAMVLRRKPALFGKVSYWSYGEWIFFWGLVGANLLVYIVPYLKRVARTKAFYERPLEFTESLELISVTFGFSCIFNLSLLFVPATRNSAWMEFFNISYANGVKYHRWLGVLTVLTGLLHCIGYYSYWIRMGMWKKMALPCFNCNLGDEAGRLAWIAVFGQLALLIFLIIGLTSIPYVRRKFYNVFYYSHQLLFVAVVLAVMHWPTIIWWIFPTFVVYCYGRARSMTSNISPIEVQELTAIHDDVVKVVLKRSPGRDGHYRVGQFLYLNVPAISKLQWHAFTIASSPKTSSTTLTVLIKSLGDWTKDLVAHANECKEKSVLPTIYVDGFHGASLEMYDEYSTILLVGGGIGATPLIAILEDIAAKLAAQKSLRQRVVFAFSFRELALLEEIHPVLVRLRELDPRELYFKTQFYLTRLPSEDIMARLVDTSRLRRKHSIATTYKPSLMAPIALSETLRSRTYRALAFTTVLVVGLLVLVYLEYGNPTGKIVRKGKQYWPLQGFVNAVVVMVLSMGIVFVYVFAERLSKLKMLALNTTAASKEVELNLFQSLETPALTVSDVHTYYDLLNHYKVVLGERPDVNAIVAEAFEFHSDPAVPSEGKPVIGVFVSGPDAMKRAVEYAVQELGVSHFDIHEEEFEL